MAFYNSSFDDYNHGQYNYYSTSYDIQSNVFNGCYDVVPFDDDSSNYSTTCYDIVPFQHSSNYEANDYDIVPFQDSSLYSTTYEFDPNAYNNAYALSITPSEVNYSSHDFIEPKLLEYNPIFHDTRYFSSDTRFVISYSKALVVDDTEFDEYDPTPYDGGFDIVQTYGKPLSPSDQICYPRFDPDPDNMPSVTFSYGSIPSPYVNAEKEVPIKEPILEKKQPSRGNGNGGNIVNEPEKAVELSKGGEIEGYNDNYGKAVIEFQGTYNGCGLEAMDLCEGLFGYWPCLDKKIRKECGYCDQQIASEENQWKSAADYLFGNYDYNT